MNKLAHFPPSWHKHSSLCCGCKFDNLDYPGSPDGTQSSVSTGDYFWQPEEDIVVWFEGGPKKWWSFIAHHFGLWRCNVNLIYPQLGEVVPDRWHERFPGRQCDMRIAFDGYNPITKTGGGSWAYPGFWQRVVAQDAISMNFGWFSESWDKGDITELKRVVLHEAGHGVVGWVHEHQNPGRGFDLSDAIYEDYARVGWSREQVEKTFDVYPNPAVIHPFIRKSIMAYSMPSHHTVPSGGIPFNTEIHPMEIKQTEKEYGVKKPGGSSTMYLPFLAN